MRKQTHAINAILMKQGLLSDHLRDSDGSPQYETANVIDLCYTYISLGYVPIGIIIHGQWGHCFTHGTQTDLTWESEEILLAGLRIWYHKRTWNKHNGFDGAFPRVVRFQKNPQKASQWRKKIKAPFLDEEWVRLEELATRQRFLNLMNN